MHGKESGGTIHGREVTCAAIAFVDSFVSLRLVKAAIHPERWPSHLCRLATHRAEKGEHLTTRRPAFFHHHGTRANREQHALAAQKLISGLGGFTREVQARDDGGAVELFGYRITKATGDAGSKAIASFFVPSRRLNVRK